MAASLELRGCQPSAIPASRTSGSAIASAVGPRRSARLGRQRGDERAREDGEQRRLDRVALSSSHHSRLRSSQLNLM